MGFAIGFTKKDKDQKCITTYAQSAQTKTIRKIMVDQMKAAAQGGDITDLLEKLMVDSIASDIVHIQKVKCVKRPKLDLGRLAELHGQGGVKTNAKGEKVERGDTYEPAVLESV